MMNGLTFLGKSTTFVSCMKQGRMETIAMRIVSTTFVVVALAVFKSFGLDAWQWQAYVHLAVLWVIGFLTCMMTDIILKYVVKLPRSFKKGVEYIIRRNVWFQMINTPLVALGICLYRHFAMSDRMESNLFSVVNFFETLVIIAFCSFAIGLYWRFKYRNKYLAMELEETRQLNEELKEMQEKLMQDTAEFDHRSFSVTTRQSQGKHHFTTSAPSVMTDVKTVSQEPENSRLNEVEKSSKKPLQQELTLTGTTNESVTLHISNLLYIEAVGNYVKVSHLRGGLVRTDMLRSTMKQMEETLHDFPMIVRCHRAFLVNLGQVEQVVLHSGSTKLLIKHCHDSLPVSRSNMTQVKAAIKQG